jgi:hypothetical protein
MIFSEAQNSIIKKYEKNSANREAAADCASRDKV